MEVGKSQRAFSFYPNFEKINQFTVPHKIKKFESDFNEDKTDIKLPSEISTTFNSGSSDKKYPRAEDNNFDHVGGNDCDCSICKVDPEEDESEEDDTQDYDSEDGGTDQYSDQYLSGEFQFKCSF